MPLSAEQLLERFNARQPPTGRLFNMQVLAVDVEAQSVRMSFEPGESLTNPRGTIQGGIVTAMLDDCAAYAGIIALGEPGFIASLEVKTSFLAPAYPGLLYGEGRCLKMQICAMPMANCLQGSPAPLCPCDQRKPPS
jgi:acyl-coenzyme A thioesterase PaaI-like protein